MNRTVKELVGVLDFSFHVVNTANSSRTAVVDDTKDILPSEKKKDD
jgi:hypothetical protein